MKCENCGSELAGGAIVCRQCNHNNAQGRVSQWRARRTADLQPPSTRTISPLSDAAKPANTGSLNKPKSNSRPLEPRRSNSIPFEPRIQINHAAPSPKGSSGSLTPPSSPQASVPATENDSETGQPAWREQLKERVKQSRERKATGPKLAQAEPDEAELDQNPIVEAALKRIRWSAHTPSAAVMPRVARRGAQAAALAHEPEFDEEPALSNDPKPSASQNVKAEPSVESMTSPKPTAGIAPTVTNPLLARRPNTQPVTPSETKPQHQFRQQSERSERPAVTAKPEPKPSIETKSEARIEIKPSVRQETKSAAESKAAEPKPRVTGELKPPAPPPPPPVTKLSPEKAQPEKIPTGPLSPAARKPVETKVIGLSQPDTTSPTKQKPAAKNRPAATWARTLAGACDFEIIATAYLPLFASYATLNTTYGSESLTILLVLLATLTFCYQLLTLTLADRTSGMALLNLRLVNTAGNDKPILFSQKFARAVVATMVFLFPLLNLISNRQHHTLPDMFSGTTLMER